MTNREIVCLGDSITAGEGVSKEDAYPAALSRELGVKVLNAGASGNVTLDGLRRLPNAVLPRRPSTAILQFGGNDLKRGYSTAQVAGNFIAMAESLRQANPQVNIIVVAPEEVLSEPRLQEDNGLSLVSIDDALGRYYDSATKHPSEAGHAAVAEVLAEVLWRTSQDSSGIRSKN